MKLIKFTVSMPHPPFILSKGDFNDIYLSMKVKSVFHAMKD